MIESSRPVSPGGGGSIEGSTVASGVGVVVEPLSIFFVLSKTFIGGQRLLRHLLMCGVVGVAVVRELETDALLFGQASPPELLLVAALPAISQRLRFAAHDTPRDVVTNSAGNNAVVVCAFGGFGLPEGPVGAEVPHLVQRELRVDPELRKAGDRVDRGDRGVELIEEDRAGFGGGHPAHTGRPALRGVGLVEDFPDVEMAVAEVELEGVL